MDVQQAVSLLPAFEKDFVHCEGRVVVFPNSDFDSGAVSLIASPLPPLSGVLR
jgi:hypothetical protein